MRGSVAMAARQGFWLAVALPLVAGAAPAAKAPAKAAAPPPAVAPAAPPADGAQGGRLTVRKLAPLSLGLVGYGGAVAARADSEKLQRYFAEKLGWQVATPVLPDYDALAAALASGSIDLAWVQPFALVKAQKKGAVVPLLKAVRGGLPFYRGVLFARDDRKADGVAALKGLRVAWVSPSSAAGYLFPRAAIVQAGFAPAKLFAKEDMAGDHLAVCRAVLDGRADVGATFADDPPAGGTMRVDGCVQALGPEAGARLRIVAASAPIPNDVIAARPGFDPAQIERVKRGLMSLAASAEGRELLQSVFKAEGFAEVGDADFEPVRFAAEAAQ